MSKKNEYGRSMVEMLGVLAVMGVLSVGGVAMYTSAMNKLKANELLNEASKRAVIVATRSLAGQSSVSLAEFSGNSSVAGGTFADEESVDTSRNTFEIKIKNVDEGVCNQMKATTGTNTVIQEISGTCGETISLVFNKDLSKGNTTSGGSSGGNEGGSDGNEGGNNETPETPIVIACSSNTPCTEANTFCQMTTSTEGTCQATGTGTTVGQFLVAPTEMNYWSAKNWCLANNKNIYVLGGAGIADNGPFCLDNFASLNIFKELFGCKTAVALTEPCMQYNTDLADVVRSTWAWRPEFSYAMILKYQETGEANVDQSKSAPVICVP